jgi:hypothetical protein
MAAVSGGERRFTPERLVSLAEGWLGGVMAACACEIPTERRGDSGAYRGIVVGCRLSRHGRGVWFYLDSGIHTFRPGEWLLGHLEAMCRE